jgi:NAD(P)H dehydrogenase (quinone)
MLRYGQGVLEGKRALVVVNSGSSEASFGPRGINGPIDHVLYPIQHGILWYTGMSVLPPVPLFEAGWCTDEQYESAVTTLRERLAAIGETEPLPYRYQNHGGYDEDLVLRADLADGATGMDVHLVDQETTPYIRLVA